MPSAKRRKKEATTPAKPREPSEDASDMPPVSGDVRFANTLAKALVAPNLLEELEGAGGLKSTAFIVGERDGVDEADVLRAVATAQAVLQPKDVRAADRTNRLADWPLVEDKDKLGEGADDAFFDGHLPEAAQKLRRLRWTPQQWVIYLQALRQLQMKHPSRPKCCFCLSMLTYISGCPLIRAMMRQAYGPMWLADGDCVLVNRLLMEAIADRAVLALMNEDDGNEQLDRTTIINVRTDEKGVAKFVGQSTGAKAKNGSAPRKAADWALDGTTAHPKPEGIAKDIHKFCKRLRERDHGAKSFADVTATATRDGFNEGAEQFEFPGDDDVFTASNVEDKDVSLALLEDGSASKKGRLQLLVPVWCSVLKAMITMRVIISRKCVDAVSEPSVEATTDMREAVIKMKDATTGKTEAYLETKLIYTPRKPASNGPNSWIVPTPGTYSDRNPGDLATDLDKGFGHAEKMSGLAHDALERAVERLGTLDQLTRFCTNKDDADRVKALIAAASKKARGSVLKTIPSLTFDQGMVDDFGTFADAVVDELNLTGLGCWTGGGKKKKKRSRRARSRSRSSSPSGAPSKKPASKKKKSKKKPARENSPERQAVIDARRRPTANADPRGQLEGARNAKAGRRK